VSLTGLAPAIPGLLGLPRDYLSAQFGAWQAGLRRADAPDCMAEIAQRMSPDDVAAVTAWLAAQPMPPAGARASTAATRLPMKCGSVDAARAASAR
jgi:cytochrome c553